MFIHRLLACTKYHIQYITLEKYLIMMSVSLRLVGVRVVFEELCHICHNRFFIWLVNVHIYK